MTFYEGVMSGYKKHRGGILRRFVAMCLAVLLALVGSGGAVAAPLPVAETCHAGARLDESAAQIAQGRWRCRDDNYSITDDVVFVRFRLLPAGQAPGAAGFVTHASTFESIDLTVIDADGTSRAAHIDAAQVHHMGVGPLIAAALPPVHDDSRFVIARIVAPWSKTLASDARLDTMPMGSGWSLGKIVAVAAIGGMLLVPLLLNGGFWFVLRQSYVVWHTVLIFTMMVQALVGTGFIHILGDLPIFMEGAISSFCYGLMGASALKFGATFLEPEVLSRRTKVAMSATAMVTLACGVVSALPFAWLRPYSTMQMYLGMGLALVMIVVGVVEAWRRGSRLVWFQIVGSAPAVAVALYRVALYILPDGHPTNSVAAQQLALAVEVIASSIGILSRLFELRRQRDSATALALELEGVAGRDALTGLWNRRSIERRFDDLFAKGFRTMAVLDLDHFKAVNDQHGHAMGDAVLRSVAAVLASDADTRAVRMGGEEFLLLLRGPDSAERAERRRRAISARIAADLPGLDRLVTASMGLVEHDTRGDLGARFEALYAHCDRLLYEAKRFGRNRTMREKLTAFAIPEAIAAS